MLCNFFEKVLKNLDRIGAEPTNFFSQIYTPLTLVFPVPNTTLQKSSF